MNDPHNDDWGWFRELLTPLRVSSDVHPSRAILYAYLKGRLRDTWRVGTRPFDPHNWTLTEVSQHALVCRDCAQQLALMRRRELERATPWHDLWHRGAIRAHLAVYLLALCALFALNAFLVMVLPAPTVLLPCVSDRAGPEQPFNSQTVDGNWKLEGLNRPAKGSLVCVPVPAPRPWWQTWWSGWVFLLWTMLVGLHILWDAGPAPRRTVATSSVLRSIGFAPILV